MGSISSSRESEYHSVNDCRNAPNMREQFTEESLRGFNKHIDYPCQAGVCGLGLVQADQGSGAVTALRESDGLRQPLTRPRSASNPEREVNPTSSHHCMRRVTTESEKGRCSAFDVHIGDDWTTITFRRTGNHPCAFEVEACHPHNDGTYSDGTPWMKECDHDYMANKLVSVASRPSSTHQHGMEHLMASPHLNDHHCSLKTGDDKYRRRTTAFIDDGPLQYHRQGDIFTDADIQSILRGGAKSSPSPRSDAESQSSSAAVTTTAGYRNPAASRSFPEMRDKCNNISNEENNDQSLKQDDGCDQGTAERYVYRSRRTSVQYGKRQRSLSRERRERDKTTTMRYEPSCAAVGSRFRDNLESFPVIVIPERGLSLQENRQKSHEQTELHEEFMKGQVGSSLAQDINARAIEKVARRRNTTANAKSHTPWIEHDQPRVSKSILARIPVGRTATDDSGVYSSRDQAGDCLPSTHSSSGNATEPVKPQWVDEADRGRTRRNRVAIARRNTLNRLKSKMGQASTKEGQETSPQSPSNELGIQAFVTSSSDEQYSDPEIVPFQRPSIGRVPSSKPIVVKSSGSKRVDPQSRKHAGDDNRAQAQPPASHYRTPSTHRKNICTPSSGQLRILSTPQSSRCASLVEGFGKDKCMSPLTRGRAHSEQQEQPVMPPPVVPRDAHNRRSEKQVPDDREDTEPITDSPSREICLDQASNDEFQPLIQEQVSSTSPPVKDLRQLQVDSVYQTPLESPTKARYRESQVDCTPLSSRSSGVSVRPLPRAAYHRRPRLHIDTQMNGSYIGSSVTSNSTTGDLAIAPSIQSWANKSVSWVEICEASAVTITNHHATSAARTNRNSPSATERIEEADEGENEGRMSESGNGQNAEQETSTAATNSDQQEQPEGEPLAMTTTSIVDEDRSKRKSEVHWVDGEMDIPPTQKEALKKEPERYRVYDEEGMKHCATPPHSQHSIQVDSQRRISTTSAAEMAERDVGSPLEYLRRSLQPTSRRASWAHGDDASSIARHIQRTQRRLEGRKSPPGPPRTFVRDPRIRHEDSKQCIWKRMGRKGLQVLTFGRAGSQRSKAENVGDDAKTPRNPTRHGGGSVLGSIMRRMSTRRSRRDRVEEETRAAVAKASEATAEKDEGCFERCPKDYRGRLRRSLSRASRRLRRRKD
ncbi:hypothetical protein KEM54_005104 [Ascosphaera aggregata]|nr:hypothetical protein KEM54_005104 [Ascosphaera aggregata]